MNYRVPDVHDIVIMLARVSGSEGNGGFYRVYAYCLSRSGGKLQFTRIQQTNLSDIAGTRRLDLHASSMFDTAVNRLVASLPTVRSRIYLYMGHSVNNLKEDVRFPTRWMHRDLTKFIPADEFFGTLPSPATYNPDTREAVNA